MYAFVIFVHVLRIKIWMYVGAREHERELRVIEGEVTLKCCKWLQPKYLEYAL